MQAKMFFLCALLVVVLASESSANTAGRKCECQSDCQTYCCIDNKCADSPKWCPCSQTQSPCEDDEKCVPQQVQCFTTPCYPIAKCVPK